MHKICNSNENCGETSNTDRMKELRSEVFFQILVQKTRSLVNILVIFSKCFFFFFSVKGKMLLEIPCLAFLIKTQGTLLRVSFGPPLGGAYGLAGR